MRKVLNIKAAFAVACAVAPFASVLVYLGTSNLLYALASLVCSTIVSLAIIRYVLIEPQHAKFLTVGKVFSIGLFCATSVVLSQSSILWQIAIPLLNRIFPDLKLPDVSEHELTAVLIGALVILATVLVAGFISKSGNVQQGTLREASALSQQELEIIARTLEDSLDSLDQELRFFDFRSPTIDPKLEELNTTSRRLNIDSALQVTSRAANCDFIVVKGEPGSGKSVMLRNLARQLLRKIGSGGKVPSY